MVTGEESRCKNLEFFPSDDVLLMKMHQRLTGLMVSHGMALRNYVRHGPSVWMDVLTDSCVPACVHMCSLVQVFTAEIS